MVHRIPMTEARINLGQLAKRAHVNNEYFILEKDGIPVIGIMDADELEDLPRTPGSKRPGTDRREQRGREGRPHPPGRGAPHYAKE